MEEEEAAPVTIGPWRDRSERGGCGETCLMLLFPLFCLICLVLTMAVLR